MITIRSMCISHSGHTSHVPTKPEKTTKAQKFGPPSHDNVRYLKKKVNGRHDCNVIVEVRGGEIDCLFVPELNNWLSFEREKKLVYMHMLVEIHELHVYFHSISSQDIKYNQTKIQHSKSASARDSHIPTCMLNQQCNFLPLLPGGSLYCTLYCQVEKN